MQDNNYATDKKQGGIHDGGTVEHGSHENVVARTVHKRHVAAQNSENMSPHDYVSNHSFNTVSIQPISCHTTTLPKLQLHD